MNSGEIHAFNHATGNPVRITYTDGTITAIMPTAETPAQDFWIAPPLVDLQINGYGGVDFQQDNLNVEDLLRATRALRRDGCAHFLATLITDDWPRLLARLR